MALFGALGSFPFLFFFCVLGPADAGSATGFEEGAGVDTCFLWAASAFLLCLRSFLFAFLSVAGVNGVGDAGVCAAVDPGGADVPGVFLSMGCPDTLDFFCAGTGVFFSFCPPAPAP